MCLVQTSEVAPQHHRYCWRMNASSVVGQIPAASGTGR